MQQATKRRLIEFVAPLLVGIGFIVKVVYYILFAWWLDPWLRREANRALLDDITKNLYFLVSDSETDVPRSINVLDTEWPTIEVRWGNLLFTVARWRDETSISVAPSHASRESYELGPLVAALENRHISYRDVVNNLGDAGDLLRPRLQALNSAFSEQMFPQFKVRL